MSWTTSFWVVALAVPALVGCGGDDGCETICRRAVECQKDTPTEAECVSICKKQYDADSDYADAVDEQADCYDDATCAEIQQGGCVPEMD